MYKFNPLSVELEFSFLTIELVEGDSQVILSDGDLTVDSGLRENDGSIIDQGNR